jgi:integrase
MARKATGQVIVRQGKRGRSYALRFRAYGRRHYLTLGNDAQGWDRWRAEVELENVLADARRGIWKPQERLEAVEPTPEPTFHEFASEWIEAVAPALAEKSRTRYRWQLTHHLLPFFAEHRLSQITVAEVDHYRDLKVREGGLVADTINGTLTRLGQILDVAEERELIERNPLRVNPRRRKLRSSKPRTVWLDRAEQIATLLDAAGELDREARKDRGHVGRRAIIASLAFGGLRIGELCALLWRDVDLAGGRLNVGEAKTDAGRRYVDLLEPLREELTAHKMGASNALGSAFVFSTSAGNPRTINNVRERVFKPAVRRAGEKLEADERAPLPAGLTPHKLRHTFASLLIALGEDPTYVMGQIGHTDPAFTLRLYAHAMHRQDGERERLRRLVGAADWAPLGTESGSTAWEATAALPSNGQKSAA